MSTDKKYDRMAVVYDYFEEKLNPFDKYRRIVAGYLRGNVLELGIGSGANLKYYDRGLDVTGVDFSEKMLAKSELKRDRLCMDKVKLVKMDIEDMSFENESFDMLSSTFVFCTVPNPEKGLSEAYRVLKKGGRAVFLEHMKSENSFINIFLYVMSFFSKLIFGTSMVRETEKNIKRAGFKIVEKRDLFFDILKFIVAEK